jgi:hypothetical protein
VSEVLIKFVGPDGSPLGKVRSGHIPRRDDTVLLDDGDVLRVTGVLWNLDDNEVTLRMGSVGGVL